jgi:alanine racemase
MTVRLTVQRSAWQRHVHGVAAALGPALVPVVKGNGYGFGRPALHHVAAGLATTVCVGNVHELHDVPHDVTPVVLTPALAPPHGPNADRAVLTVGSAAHTVPLHGWHGRVMVKLQSSMRRYGAPPDALGDLIAAVGHADLAVEAFALHLPLAGDDAARRAEIDAWLPQLPATAPLWLSHLSSATFAALQDDHPDRAFHLRVGTALWHGPKTFLHLSADVLQTQPVRAGDIAGYRHHAVPCDGTLVAVGGGSANGIAALDGGLSPFHFGGRRLALLEPPHMHTSLVLVPHGDPCPVVGDLVDVQRPLITTAVDELEWLP